MPYQVKLRRFSCIYLPQLYANSLLMFLIFLDPPQEFSSENFEDPVIAVNEEETKVEVTLLCKVNIRNGIEKWSNVTYKIEWFAGGKSVYSQEICGNLPPGKEKSLVQMENLLPN